MKIAVDAMGGDFGPMVPVEGAVRAAEELATLQDQNLDAGSGQVGGGHQTVVTTADNDEVI